VYKAIQDENTKLCFIFHSTHSVLYFPWIIQHQKYCSIYVTIN